MSQGASAIFDIIAPQLASDPAKTDYISWARDRTNICYYGTQAERAVALRAAHMMTLDKLVQSSGGSGEIASKREGDLSISYHKSSNGQGSDLSSTGYGRQLIGLMEGSGAFIGVTGGNDNGCYN